MGALDASKLRDAPDPIYFCSTMHRMLSQEPTVSLRSSSNQQLHWGGKTTEVEKQGLMKLLPAWSLASTRYLTLKTEESPSSEFCRSFTVPHEFLLLLFIYRHAHGLAPALVRTFPVQQQQQQQQQQRRTVTRPKKGSTPGLHVPTHLKSSNDDSIISSKDLSRQQEDVGTSADQLQPQHGGQGKPGGFRASARAAWEILGQAVDLLRRNLWAILIIYAAKDMLSFMLHRLLQRATNLGEGSLSPKLILG